MIAVARHRDVQAGLRSACADTNQRSRTPRAAPSADAPPSRGAAPLGSLTVLPRTSQARNGAAGSVRGVGTVVSSLATTSSELTCRTQSSGRSVIR